MIRKTRLMSKSGVMLVRIEVFQDGILRSTSFKVSTATAGRTFTSLAKSIDAFRAMGRRPAEAPRLQKAA